MIKRQLRLLGKLGTLLLVLGLGLVAGVALDRYAPGALAIPKAFASNAGPDFHLMLEAWNMIQQNYVDRAAVQPQQLTYGAINGMVDALGDTGHSRFLTPQMLQMENDFTQGQFEGVGIEVQMENGHVVVVAPIDGSPAQQAGLQSSDIILQVNGEDMTGLALDQVVQHVLGPAGTPVTLTILEPSTGQTRNVTLTRAKITLHNVTWQRLPGTTVAHVRITAFSQGVSQDLHKTLEDIQQQGMTAIVLDLRNDPGGLLDESVGASSQFLKSGNVLEEKNVRGEIKPVPVDSKYAVTDLPMVVLINGGTASAAEIFAGALQDAHRARLAGEATFGTGTVLSEFRLSDGSALLLATEEWLTPNGRVIWHQGITPDVLVPLPAGASPLFPEAEQRMTAAQLQSSGDEQLLRALSLLVQPAVPTAP